jgi:protein-S-isoprenylcysteine O-methyltransferase Ste14
MVIVPAELTGIFWLIFILYWLFSAISAKKIVRMGIWWKGGIIRILAAIMLVLLLNHSSLQQSLTHYSKSIPVYLGYIGVLLCALGISFAIWARWHLGTNWGMPATIRVNPELVTSGPYTYVRHPIYTGVLLASLGSALADGYLWLVMFIIFCVYFIYSATREEKNMAELFPTEYPQYKQRTKMLIPFIF